MYQDSRTLRQRIAKLQKVFPLFLVVLVFVYQLGPARLVHDAFGHPYHYAVEIVFYASVGPLLTYWILNLIKRWLDEKEQAERQARASERRLASITNFSADAIIGIDREGNIESWNRGAELLFGYLEEEINGRPFSVLLEGETASKVELAWLERTVYQNGYIRGHETICGDLEGRKLVVELTATQLTDDQGDSVGMSVILRDITERKRREEEIQHLNASLNQQVADRTRELAKKVDELARANSDLQKLDQMKSEFVSLVSHQLRAPLTNMNGAVTRIQNECAVINPTCTRMLDILNQQTMRLERLVKDVLNSARLESGELSLLSEPVSVQPILEQIVEQTLARSIDRPIRVMEKPGLPLVIADRDRLAEVLTNLLDNADKYSPPGEEVVVEARADQREVTVSVYDVGSGLLPDDFERVFDKFYRTDNSDSQLAYGYGLGLYVCKLLVEAQGGRIWVENNPEGGAVFSFALPAWQGQINIKEKEASAHD